MSERFVATVGEIEASSDGLTGVIWSTGQHTLRLNGEPATVEVTDESLRETYSRLTNRLEGGSRGVTLGFDHPEPGSVAAETDIGTLGHVDAVSLSSSTGEIVMEQSTITNSAAKQAFDAGQFDALDFSIVGDVEVTERDGKPPLVMADIRRVDLVDEGAVANAGVGTVPSVAAALAAVDDPGDLDASAAFRDSIGHTPPVAFQSPEEYHSFAWDVMNVIEAKDEHIRRLRDDVAAAETRAAAFDTATDLLDLSDDDGPETLVERATIDLRQEVAELEATLPSEQCDDVTRRVDDLAGTPVDELEARAGELSRRLQKAQRAKAGRSRAIAASSPDRLLGGSDDDALEAMADAVLDPHEVAEASERGGASSYIEEEYDLDVSNFDNEHDLQAKMSEIRTSSTNGQGGAQ